MTSSTNAPSRPSTLRIVLRDVGGLLILVGALMGVPLLVALGYGEAYTALAFLTASGVTTGVGAAFYWLLREAAEPQTKDALVIAGAGWLFIAVFGALPFLFAAYFTPPEIAQGFMPAGETYTSRLLNFKSAVHALFDAVNHAMTGQFTGGFSTLDDSIAGYGSYAMDLVHIPPMILDAISIPLYYLLFRKRSLRIFWRDPQARSLLVLFALGVPTVIYLLEDGAEIIEVEVEPEAALASTTLVEANERDLFPGDTTVMAVQRAGPLLVPNGATRLEAGDLVTVLDLENVSKAVTRPFQRAA